MQFLHKFYLKENRYLQKKKRYGRKKEKQHQTSCNRKMTEQEKNKIIKKDNL